MERTPRLIFLALAIGWTLFRLLRYARLANSKRPGPAVPAAVGALPQQPATPSAPPTAQSPIEAPSGGGSRLAGVLAAAGILVAGNALLWPILFAVPAFETVPTIWRLTAGVLANLLLLPLASAAAVRAGRGSRQSASDDRNPIK